MKPNKLITFLKHKKLFILSPHFDDAVLSAGMLLYYLRNSAGCTVINIFTLAHNGPYTLSALRYLNESGYSNAVKLYRDRKIEDKKALTMLKVKHLNLALTDALFRQKRTKQPFLAKYFAEFNSVYPTYRWHIVKKIDPDDSAISELESKLKKIIPKDALVLAPFGLGNHADHLITHRISRRLFINTIYYVDFPYSIRLRKSGQPLPGFTKHELTVDLPIKSKLIQQYTSQINGLFNGNRIPRHHETFYVPEKFNQ